jgi:hypothetical protein
MQKYRDDRKGLDTPPRRAENAGAERSEAMTKMDMIELRKAKKSLEFEIASIIDQKVREFREHTQFSPHRISVNLQEVQTIGTIDPEYIVGSVDVDIRV